MKNRQQSVVGARRAICCVLGAVLIIVCSFYPDEAQPQARIFQIGFLGLPSAHGWAEKTAAFRAGLRDLGYVEGKNLVIHFRWADGQYQRLPDLVAELLRLRVDVIVTHAAVGTRAAKEATGTIPIVIAAVGDAVGAGLVSSLAHPGGNVTGSSFYLPELRIKRLELLREAFPKIARVAVLLNSITGWKRAAHEIDLAAKSLKLDLQEFLVNATNEFESSFVEMVGRRMDAVIISEDPMLVSNVKDLAHLALQKRLPSIGFEEFADAGGLMSYSASIVEMHRRAAYFVDRILNGAKPAELPVEQPRKFEFVVNLKTVKRIGLTIPPNVLARADRVIR